MSINFVEKKDRLLYNSGKMNKVDYNVKMKQIIQENEGKKSILLHSCCAPCSSSVLHKISEYFDVTVVYYNPNIYPQGEYEKRKLEQIKLLNIMQIPFLDSDYNENDFLNAVVGLENEKEGGARCNKCFLIRLDETARLAKQKGFDFFGTTLTVSPHKNAETINQIGAALADKYGIKYLFSDFKKEDGYLNSIKLSKQYNLYRQDYCGCKFSKN